MLKNSHIVCIAAADWAGMWARAQQIMTLLAKEGNTILYIDPPITLLSPIKNLDLWGNWARWWEGVRQVDENIYVYTPPIFLPFGNKYAGINNLNQKALALGMKRAMDRLGFGEDYILWTYLHTTADLIDRVKPGFVVYDCADEHAAFTGFITKETVDKLEERLIKKSDAVFATATELRNRKQKYREDIHLVPNGADVDHFKQALKTDFPVAEELQNLPRPIIGFYGGISDWIDLASVEEVAKAHPEWSVVMVGPVDTDITHLKKYPNLQFLGKRDYGRLPTYLKGFDVCLVPFKINDLTVNVNPVKLYEYLAAGKPVVSSPLPEVRQFNEVVRIGETPAEFLAQVEAALVETGAEEVARRVAVAEDNSWQARCNRMVEVIQERRGEL
ncbi:MAG: glycosyltransferase [Clostridia bacterium]|nr:glycosyltransferase [Clostridia bacterium]